jgi:hypothetical protein
MPPRRKGASKDNPWTIDQYRRVIIQFYKWTKGITGRDLTAEEERDAKYYKGWLRSSGRGEAPDAPLDRLWDHIMSFRNPSTRSTYLLGVSRMLLWDYTDRDARFIKWNSEAIRQRVIWDKYQGESYRYDGTEATAEGGRQKRFTTLEEFGALRDQLFNGQAILGKNGRNGWHLAYEAKQPASVIDYFYWFAMCLYTLQPPLRRDWGEIKIVGSERDADGGKINYLVVPGLKSHYADIDRGGYVFVMPKAVKGIIKFPEPDPAVTQGPYAAVAARYKRDYSDNSSNSNSSNSSNSSSEFNSAGAGPSTFNPYDGLAAAHSNATPPSARTYVTARSVLERLPADLGNSRLQPGERSLINSPGGYVKFSNQGLSKSDVDDEFRMFLIINDDKVSDMPEYQTKQARKIYILPALAKIIVQSLSLFHRPYVLPYVKTNSVDFELPMKSEGVTQFLHRLNIDRPVQSLRSAYATKVYNSPYVTYNQMMAVCRSMRHRLDTAFLHYRKAERPPPGMGGLPGMEPYDPAAPRPQPPAAANEAGPSSAAARPRTGPAAAPAAPAAPPPVRSSRWHRYTKGWIRDADHPERKEGIAAAKRKYYEDNKAWVKQRTLLAEMKRGRVPKPWTLARWAIVRGEDGSWQPHGRIKPDSKEARANAKRLATTARQGAPRTRRPAAAPAAAPAAPPAAAAPAEPASGNRARGRPSGRPSGQAARPAANQAPRQPSPRENEPGPSTRAKTKRRRQGQTKEFTPPNNNNKRSRA